MLFLVLVVLPFGFSIKPLHMFFRRIKDTILKEREDLLSFGRFHFLLEQEEVDYHTFSVKVRFDGEHCQIENKQGVKCLFPCKADKVDWFMIKLCPHVYRINKEMYG